MVSRLRHRLRVGHWPLWLAMWDEALDGAAKDEWCAHCGRLRSNDEPRYPVATAADIESERMGW